MVNNPLLSLKMILIIRKYRDDHVMNQFKALSMESEDDDPFPSRVDAVSSESEEEVYTKQPRGAKK